MQTLRKLCAAAAFLFAATGNAATIDPKLAKGDTCGRYELFSINGIMTDFQGATDNQIRLQAVYGNAYKEHLIAFRLAFNQTRGLPQDVFDSAMQVISLYAGVTWDMWLKAVTFGIYDPAISPAAAEAIAKQITDLYGLTRPAPYEDADLTDIVTAITSQTAGGARRLLVGHSQGSIYLTLVYNKLLSKGMAAKTLGAVGIAVAYSSIPTGNEYVTSDNDLVIDAVRLATRPLTLAGAPPVLAANISNPYRPLSDVYGHNLQQTYLSSANRASISKITSLIKSEFGRLKSPYPATMLPYEIVYATVQRNTVCSVSLPCTPDLDPMIQFTQPYIWWFTPSYSGQFYVWKGGTEGDAVTQARANARACYQLHIDATKFQRSQGNMGWVTAPAGCWDMLSRSDGSWWVYSADATYQESWWDTYNSNGKSTMGAMCKT